MPELPEVETVRAGLRPHIEGRRILNCEQRRADLRFPFPEDFAARLTGRRIVEAARRAKYLLLRLDDGWTWMVHLGMSGRFTVSQPKQMSDQTASSANSGRTTSAQAGHNSGWALIDKHDHLLVDIEGGARLIYNDVRRFGFMHLFETTQESQNKHLAALGPEPNTSAFSGASLTEALRNKKTPIKSALLDQTVVAGLGNIYVCEALWRAGLSPRRSAHTIAGKRADRLVTAINQVIAEAIAAGGSSLRDYVGADGELGYFQHSFDAYDREGQPCKQTGCPGEIVRIVQSGRSTFFCPHHQR